MVAFDELMGRVAGWFGRVEPRRSAWAFMLGLLSDPPRKNCWSIAEQAGAATPDGMQHLLAGARRDAGGDAGGIGDDLGDSVTEHLGHPDAVLVVDETGDVKKGTATAGVARQYCGTAGKVENCQVAVFLTYASAAGHALIDRELYLPHLWAGDPGRRRAAGIAEGIAFATKPQLAQVMIARALDAGTPASWVAGDEVYGADPGLRAYLEHRQAGYVLAVAKTCRVATGAGLSQGRHGRCPPAPAGVAAVLSRPRCQRPPLLRLGLGGHRARPARLPLAADPPPPAHPRAGVLPLLLTPPRPLGHPGQGRRAALGHRGELPGR
jgi:SRSO17 transposase